MRSSGSARNKSPLEAQRRSASMARMSNVPVPLGPTPRSAVCIHCRTLLGPNEACDGGPKHKIAALSTKEGRAALLKEVWGPPSARRRARQLAKAGGGGLGLGGLLDGCGSCGDCGGVALDGEFLAVIGVVLIAVVAVVALYWLIVKIIEWVRAYQNRPKPHGALLRPASVGRKIGPSGVVVAGMPMLAPASGQQCVAWCLDLRSKRFLGADLMLHDAETVGFDVKLDDGTIARIPRGRIRLEGPKKRLSRSDADRVDAFVESISPVDDPEDEGLAPFPYDVVDELVVRPGDRIRLFGEFSREGDANASADYRAASAILVPQGVPAIKVEKA